MILVRLLLLPQGAGGQVVCTRAFVAQADRVPAGNDLRILHGALETVLSVRVDQEKVLELGALTSAGAPSSVQRMWSCRYSQNKNSATPAASIKLGRPGGGRAIIVFVVSNYFIEMRRLANRKTPWN